MNQKIIATIEARMTGKRLPGKVLKKAAGKPMLQILIERLLKSKRLNGVVVATTTNQTDDPIVELAQSLKIPYFRGSEENVLERVSNAAQANGANIIVEITGDCPLIDPKLIDDAVDCFLENFPKHRYVSNFYQSQTVPAGMDVQVFSAEDLIAVLNNNPTEEEKEHVSCRFFRPPHDKFYQPLRVDYKIKELVRPDIWVTLDYEEDYILLKAAYEDLIQNIGENFTVIDVIRWIDMNETLHKKALQRRGL